MEALYIFLFRWILLTCLGEMGCYCLAGDEYFYRREIKECARNALTFLSNASFNKGFLTMNGFYLFLEMGG